MTKARFQSAILLDAEDTAFLAFAKAKGLGKSRADVIRKLITARRIQYQDGFHKWLRSPEGQAVIRVEGLGSVSSVAGPLTKVRIGEQAVEGLLDRAGEAPTPIKVVEAPENTEIEQDEGESGS